MLPVRSATATRIHTMNRLLAFYYGSHPDHQGRLLAEILRQDDLWWETTHDFIQWVFPLAEASRVVPGSPLVDRATAQAFGSDEILQAHLRASYGRMLAFLGLRHDGRTVVKAASWPARRAEWFTQPTHNSLRITRVLKSLQLLGLTAEAAAFHAALQALCEHEPGAGIGAEARRYWARAVESPGKARGKAAR